MKDKIDIMKVKQFAEENWCKDEKEQFYVDNVEFAVTNPWIDHSGRFALSDSEAVAEWGLELVIEFCIGAMERIEKN